MEEILKKMSIYKDIAFYEISEKERDQLRILIDKGEAIVSRIGTYSGEIYYKLKDATK